MENPHSILKKVFGYDSFRPGQEQIVSRLLAGQDVLAVMPTGAGKSICYQVPALLLPGITIVVSPLVSLMKDQVGALVQAGVAAAFLNNSLTDNQKALMLHRAREGWYKIIYVAPERLEMPGFQRFAQERQISMVTVDEAHCISQWGQDFRPSYLRIKAFVDSLPSRPVMGAFTATATAHVREDIRTHLALQAPYEVTTSFDRPNLYFETRRALPSQKPKELLELVLDTKAAVEKAPRTFDAAAHHALARRAAAQSIVLLRNEGALLPLKKGEKIAVLGDFARTPRYQGAGSSAVNSIQVDSFLDCLTESGLTNVGYAQGFDRQGKADEDLKKEAVALAQNANVVLLCMGLDEIKESEGIDRADMKLAENQLELLAAVAAANPNVVVLLSAGSSLESDWVKDCKALVYGCLGGQAGAGALVEVLTGAQNPCGKLAETWARSYADTPAKEHFGGDGPTVEYREGLYVGYRYYDTAGVPTAFPFGYGLSYTSFAYSDLKADETGVTLTVTNTGSCAGAEVVQLYVAKPDAKVFRPVKELKGFAKVQLEAGESKTVTIPLDDKAFRYWNVKTDRWEVEGGSYQLLVGASSADIRLTAAVTVAGTGAPDPYAGKDLAHYRTAQVQKVPDAEFEALLGRPIPENKVHIDRNMTLGEMGHGRSPIGWLAAAVLGALLRRSIKKGKPDLNILFQYNMPLRALAKMTNGAISMGMVDGIVMELQGFWIIGLVRVIFEAVKNLVLNSRMEERLKNS